MLRDKSLIWLLLFYMLFQLGALFLSSVISLFAYIVVYMIAVIYAAIKASKAVMHNRHIKVAIHSLTLFFIANIVLFLIYLPTLIYNPEINWKLKGEIGQDPMIFQAYVPIVFFIIGTIVIVLTTIVSKVILYHRTSHEAG